MRALPLLLPLLLACAAPSCTTPAALLAASSAPAARQALLAAAAASRLRRPTTADAPCPALPPLAPLPSPLPAPLAAALASLQALFTATLNATSAPGGALLVAYGGAPLLTHYAGVADKASGAPVSAATLFRIASVSKVFPAVLLYQLADAGVLGLDDALAAHLPFSMRNPVDGAQVTLRQLASHLGGLPREPPPGAATTADVLAALASQYLILPPGQLPSYSNLGYALLGHALAEGGPAPTTLPQLVQSALLDPLNLTSTGYAYSQQVLQRLAAGYDARGAPVPLADLGWGFPAGSMYSSARDLAALAQALLAQGGGPLGLSPSRARELLAPVFWNRDGASLVGTPWECRTSLHHLQLTKGGNLPGYTASLALVPSLNLSLVALWNGGVDEFGFVDSAMAALLPALDGALQALAPSPAYDPGPSPGDYVGQYQLAAGGSTVTVSLAQGMLLWREVGALGVGVLLQWFTTDPVLGDLFRAAFPDSEFGCLLGELEALRYQYVVFARDCDSGSVSATSMPGWVPGAVWQRL